MKSVYEQLPEKFIERIKEIYPERWQGVFKSFCGQKKLGIRVNLVKYSPELFIEELNRNKISYRQLEYNKNAFVLEPEYKRRIQESQIYRAGCVYIQNIASMLAVFVLSPDKGNAIMDLCAAPGSKTSQIVSRMQTNADIIAVEKIKKRFYKLVDNLKKQDSFKNVEVKMADGIKIWRKYEGCFDKVLVDAPCSSEGKFSLSEPKTYNFWSLRKIKDMQRKQKKLLFSGIKSLRKNGRLVYSTCSFFPEENEKVIDWALKKFYPDLVLEEINLPIENFVEGFRRWRNREFSEQVSKCRRVLPDSEMDGFFIASLRKK